jgi:hypothetical protein
MLFAGRLYFTDNPNEGTNTRNTLLINTKPAMLFSMASVALLVMSAVAKATDTAKIQGGQWRTSDIVIEMTNPATRTGTIGETKMDTRGRK